MYSFEDYNQETEATRLGEHISQTYLLLGLIGELGEFSELLLDKLTEIDPYLLQLLGDFVEIARDIELYKKESQKKGRVDAKSDDLDIKAVIEELGGVFWFLNSSAENAGTSLEEVAKTNAAMLKERFKRNQNWMKGGEKYKG